MWAHWTELCARIGDRRAGGPGEQAAADYILAQFRSLGLERAEAETFPCRTVRKAEAEITVRNGGRSGRVPARVLAGSPSTPGGKPVEGELVWVEMPEQAARKFTPALRGKIAVLVGPTPTRADLHRRMVACRPAAVIHLDDRLPFDWSKADGVYPAWVRRYGMPPIVAVPYRLGWELRRSGATRARVRVAVDLQDSASQNVVGEIAGRRPELPAVVLGAHHDTQCDHVGADDNASGVVALLEMAALLAGSRPLRPIRFISFGAEEQLSVGSAAYVRRHRPRLTDVGVVLNLDSVSSPLGHHWLIRAGRADFGRWLTAQFRRLGLDVADRPAPMPFADHFPFSVFGTPAITLYRPNMDSGMRWQHHSPHDNLDNVSVDELARVTRAVAGVARILANRSRWPFQRGLDPDQAPETRRLGRDLYGLG